MLGSAEKIKLNEKGDLLTILLSPECAAIDIFARMKFYIVKCFWDVWSFINFNWMIWEEFKEIQNDENKLSHKMYNKFEAPPTTPKISTPQRITNYKFHHKTIVNNIHKH